MAVVADDDAATREVVRIRLERLGYTVATAADGSHALGLARELSPDIAILDVAMPLMTGLEVTRALKADRATAHIPVILLTARAQEADIARGYDAGASDYLVKPFTARELVEAVRRKEGELRLERAEAAARMLAGERARMVAEHGALRRVATEAIRRGGEGVFDLVAEEAARLLGARSGAVFVFRDETAEAVGAWAATGVSPRPMGSLLPLAGGTAVAKVARSGSASARLDEVIDGVPGGPASGARPWARSALAAAVRVNGGLWGAVGLASDEPDTFGADAEGRLAGFVELLELALTSAEDKRSLARRAREQEALSHISAAVARVRDEAAVFRIAAAEVARGARAERCAIVTLDPVSGSPEAIAGWPADPGADGLTELQDRVVREVARTRAAAHATARPPVAGRAVTAVPIRMGPDLWGALCVEGPEPPFERLVGLLATIADLLGIALGNAEDRRRLAELAITDHLTDLPNRRAFEARLAAEVDRARRYGRRLSLAIIDLDHFKTINDGHGHDAGDAALKEASRRLARGVRRGELFARIGGEEFAWILPEVDAPSALAAAERARQALSAAPFDGIGDVTCSIGVAALAADTHAAELFRTADRALYEAKRAGRDRTVVAGGPPE